MDGFGRVEIQILNETRSPFSSNIWLAGHPRFQISIENASLFQWKIDGLVGSCKGFHQDSEIVSRGGILYHTWPTPPGFLFRIYLVALHPGILYHTVPHELSITKVPHAAFYFSLCAWNCISKYWKNHAKKSNVSKPDIQYFIRNFIQNLISGYRPYSPYLSDSKSFLAHTECGASSQIYLKFNRFVW